WYDDRVAHFISKMATLTPSLKKNVVPDKNSRRKRSAPAFSASSTMRSSPYRTDNARSGSNAIIGDLSSCPSIIAIEPSGPMNTRPDNSALIPDAGTNATAWTFVDSVISLCRKSLASDGDISDEGMFLLLVKRCGVLEAGF